MTKKFNWQKVKRIISAVCLTLSILLFLMATYIAIASTVARSRGEQPRVFGMSFSLVITDSMHGEIEVGELIIYNNSTIDKVSEGDNIVFIATSGAVSGQSVVHKAISIGEDELGIFIQTKGVNNDMPDENLVRSSNFRGVVVMHSAFLGTIVSFFSNIVNLIIFVVVILAFVVAISQVIKLIGYIVKKPEDEEQESEEEMKKRLTAEILGEEQGQLCDKNELSEEVDTSNKASEEDKPSEQDDSSEQAAQTPESDEKLDK